MTCMVSSSLIITASLRWLNDVGGLDFVHVSLLLIGQHGLGHFLRYRPFLPIGWRIVQVLRQLQRKTTNTEPSILCAIQAASQSPFINEQLHILYSACD